MQLKQEVGDSVGSYKTELATRIESIANSIDGGKRELANLSGVEEGQLYRYLRGENVPSIYAIVRIADAVGVSVEWLATGRGNSKPIEDQDATFEAEFARVPIYNVSISAGHGAFPAHEQAIGHLAFTRHWLRKAGVQAEHLVATNAAGDSMEPTIHDGDMLLIDTHQRQLTRDDIYAIRRDDVVLVKRLQQEFNNTVRVISDNQRYPPMSVSADNLHIIGRVIWLGHTL